MKKLLLAALAALLILPACLPAEDISSDAASSTAVNRTVVGQVENGEAQLTLSQAKLKTAFREAFEAESAGDIYLEQESDQFFLRGLVTNHEGSTTTFAVNLDLDDSNGLGFDVFGVTRTCTSGANCNGCELTISTTSKYGGYCTCWVKPVSSQAGYCTFKVNVTEEAESLEGNKQALPEVNPTLFRAVAILNQK